MPDITIGNIKVGVIPDFTGFAEKLRAGLGPAMQQAMANMQTANQRINGNASGSTSAASHIANAQASSGFGLGNRFTGSAGYAPPGFAGMNGTGAQVANALTRAALAIERAADRINFATTRVSHGEASVERATAAIHAPSPRTSSRSAFTRRIPFYPRGIASRAIGSIMEGSGEAEAGAAGSLTLGGAAAIGAGALSAKYLLDQYVKQLGNEHSFTMAKLSGASPFDLVRTQLNQFEENQSGVKLAIRHLGENFADAAGIQGSFLTRPREFEESASGTIRSGELRDFYHRNSAQARNMQLEMEEAGELNEFARARIHRRRAGGERNLEIMSTYGDLEATFDRNDPRRFALEKQEREQLNKSIQANHIVDAAAEREERFGYRLQSMQDLGYIEGANYRMSGQQRSAIQSQTAYNEMIFNATRSRNFDMTTDAGREAAQHAYDRIAKEGQESLYNWDKDAMRARFALRIQNESLSILTARDGGTPAMRNMAANANDIIRHTQLEAMEAFQSGHPDLVQGIYQRGRGQARLAQQDFLNGLVASEVDPRRTALSGPGTENPTTYLMSMDKALQELTYRIPQNLGDLLRQLGLNGGGALAS